MSSWSRTDWSRKAVSADLVLEQLEERIVLDGDWQPVDGFDYQQVDDVSYFRQPDGEGGFDAMFKFDQTNDVDQWYEHNGHSDTAAGTDWYAIGAAGVLHQSDGSLMNGDVHVIADGLTYQYDSVENRSQWDSTFMGEFAYDYDDTMYYQKTGPESTDWTATGEVSPIFYAYSATPNDWDLANDWEYRHNTSWNQSFWSHSNGAGGYDALFALDDGTGQWLEHNGYSPYYYGSGKWYAVTDPAGLGTNEGLLSGDSYDLGDGITYQFDIGENRSYWTSTFMGQFAYDYDDTMYYQKTGPEASDWGATGEVSPIFYVYGSTPNDWDLANDWEYRYNTTWNQSFWYHSNGAGGYDALFALNDATGQWLEHNGYSANYYGSGKWYAVADSAVLGDNVGLLSGDSHNLGDGITYQFDIGENRSYWTSTFLGEFAYDYDDTMYYQKTGPEASDWGATGEVSPIFYAYSSTPNDWDLANDWEYRHNTSWNQSFWSHSNGAGGYDALFALNDATGQWFEHNGYSPYYYGSGKWYAVTDPGELGDNVGLLSGDSHNLGDGITYQFDIGENRSYWTSTFLGEFAYDYDDTMYYQKTGPESTDWTATGEVSPIFYAYGSTPNDWDLANDWEYRHNTSWNQSFWSHSNGAGGYDALFALNDATGQWLEHNGYSPYYYGSGKWYAVADPAVLGDNVGLLSGDSHNLGDGITYQFDIGENRSYWTSTFMGQFAYDYDDTMYYQKTGPEASDWGATGEVSPIFYAYSSTPNDWDLANNWEYRHNTSWNQSFWSHSNGAGGYDALFALNDATGQWLEHNGYSPYYYGSGKWYAVADPAVLGDNVGLLSGESHNLGDGITYQFDIGENRSYWTSTFMGQFAYDYDDGLYYQKTGLESTNWTTTGEMSPIWYTYGSTPNDWDLANNWEYRHNTNWNQSFWFHSNGAGGYDALFALDDATGQWLEHDGYSANYYGSGKWYVVADPGVLEDNVGLVNGESHDLGDGISFRLDYAENASYWTHDPIGEFRFDYDTTEWSMHHSRVGSSVDWWTMDAGASPKFVFDNESEWHYAGDGLRFQYDSTENYTWWEYDSDNDGVFDFSAPYNEWVDQRFYYDNDTAVGGLQWYKYKNNGPQYWAYGESGEEAFPWFLDTNDTPTITAPTAVQVIASEGGSMTFSDANSNLIEIADRDLFGESLRVTLICSNGTMTLASGDHLGRLDSLSGDGTDTIRMIGTIEDVNLALNGLVYDAEDGFSGWAGIFVGNNDLGATGQAGSWGAQGSFLKVDVAVNLAPASYPTNEATVVTIPGSQVTDVETPVVFTSENGNAILIEDGDGADSLYAVKIFAPYGGDLSLNPEALSSLLFYAGDGVEDAVVFFSGSLDEVQLALDGLTYTPSAEFSGTTDGFAGFWLYTIDGGIDGTGGPYADAQWVQVAVDPVNEPVSIDPRLDDLFTVDIDASITFSGDNAIQVTDPDAGDNDIQVVVKPTNGSLDLNEDWETLTAELTQFLGTSTTFYKMVGTVDEINAVLADIEFNATGSSQGWGGILVTANDLGSTGGYDNGGATAIDMVDINVGSATIADNTAPENTVPTEWQTVVNDGATSLEFSTTNGNAISISDEESDDESPPPDGDLVAVLLYSANGTMSLSSYAGLSPTEGIDPDSPSSFMRFSGTYYAVNAALEGMTYTPNAGYTGWAYIQVYSNDLGYQAIGAPMGDNDTVFIEVLPADHGAPVNTVPDTEISVAKDGELFFTGDNAVEIDDTNDLGNDIKVTLLTYNGTLNVSDPLELSSGNGTSEVEIIGTETEVNGVLATLSFTPETGYTGWSQLQVITNDGGPSGEDWQNGLIDVDVVDIAVGIPEGFTPDNQLPVFDAFPESQIVQENGVLIFNSAHDNLISASDPDDPTGTEGVYSYRLYASGGTLTLGSTDNIEFTYGDGEDDTTLYISGTLEDLNAAMDGLIFTPYYGNALGRASILLHFSDGGYWGLGTDRADTSVTDTIMISMDPVNDPIHNVFDIDDDPDVGLQGTPGDYQTDVNTILTFSWANENLIQVSDWDEIGLQSYPGSYLYQEVTLTAEHGNITVNTAFSLQFAGIFNVTGNGTDTVTITGAQWDINETFDGMTFTPETDYEGYAGILVTSTDLGNVGGGNAHYATDRIDITVGDPQDFPVNEAPIVWVPLTQTLAEDSSVTFSTANENPIVIFDPDSGSDELYYELIASHGTMTLASTSGLSFILGDGTNDYGMRFYGSMDDINAALDGLEFQADTGYEGEAGILVRGHDQGNNGIGNARWGAAKVLMDITPVYNDTPIADPQSVQATEDVPLQIVLTGDDGDGAQSQTLTYYLDSLPDQGNLYASEADALARTGALSTGELVGIDTVWYMSDVDDSTDTAFTFHVQDDGGGAEDTSATVTVDVSVAPANDAPELDDSGTMTLTTINEDQTSNSGNTVADIISSAGGDRITDVDSGALEGIALTATVDNDLGVWQYSLDEGASWADVNGVSSTSALLLRSTDYIRFAPAGENGGTATISFVAWDQTAYSAGRQVDLTETGTGNTTPFSDDTEDAEITITDVNDAPVVSLGGGATMEYTEGDGAKVICDELTVDDVDVGDLNLESAVIEITGNYVAAEDFLGLAPGDERGGVDVSITDETLTITGTASLADYEYMLQHITYTNSSEDPSTLDRTITWTVYDGTDYSVPQESVVNFTAVNDAPVLDNSRTMTLDTILWNETSNSGTTVEEIISSAGGDRITDVDSGALEGIAIYATADNGLGTWQYWLDGGSSWTDIGLVSETSALLLRGDLGSTDSIRFVPAGTEGVATISFVCLGSDGLFRRLEGGCEHGRGLHAVQPCV